MKNKIIVSSLISLLIVGLSLFLVFVGNAEKNATTNTNLVATSNLQTKTYVVISDTKTKVKPGVYWYQNEDLSWRADTTFGSIVAKNKNGYPERTITTQRFDLTKYMVPKITEFKTKDETKTFNRS